MLKSADGYSIAEWIAAKAEEASRRDNTNQELAEMKKKICQNLVQCADDGSLGSYIEEATKERVRAALVQSAEQGVLEKVLIEGNQAAVLGRMECGSHVEVVASFVKGARSIVGTSPFMSAHLAACAAGVASDMPQKAPGTTNPTVASALAKLAIC